MSGVGVDPYSIRSFSGRSLAAASTPPSAPLTSGWPTSPRWPNKNNNKNDNNDNTNVTITVNNNIKTTTTTTTTTSNNNNNDSSDPATPRGPGAQRRPSIVLVPCVL